MAQHYKKAEPRAFVFAFHLLIHVADAHGPCPWPGGWVAQGREPHGCGDRAYRDVLAAAPAQPIYPALPMNRFAATHKGLRRSPTFAADVRMNLRKRISVIVPTTPHSSMSADEVP